MIFGVDYYPEHWEKTEWEKHVGLMKEGGFNTVRIGEFAWKIMERKEGQFDFSLFDEAMEGLKKADVQVILGTPTATPPKWLADKYDILQRDKFGRKREFGSRRECCANNPEYQRYSWKIVEEMAAHFKGNTQVIGWQIDNEFGCHASTRCYCDHCKKAFQKYLEEKYENIDELNRRMGTVFWGHEYDSFEEVILPAYHSCDGELGGVMGHNPSLGLEYRRFASKSWVDYQKKQIEIIRKYSDAPITHNLMGHFADIDYYKLSEDLDYVSWDNYPDNQWGDSQYEYVSMANENMYGAKEKNFIVMEQQAGPAGWEKVGQTPRPGQLRLWTWQAVAHGAEGIVYFRFRTALFGMEQYWYGVLDHDGVPRRRFYELKQTGEELKKLEQYIVGEENEYDALVVKSYDHVWAHEMTQHAAGYDYRDLLYAYYKANTDLNIMTAVGNLTTADKLQKYKVIFMPSHNLLSDAEAAEVKRYVEKGGILVTTFRSGTRNEDNVIRPIAVPGVFADIAGIEVSEFDAPRREVAITGAFESKAHIWCDVIEPKTAQVLCTYGSEYYKEKAAITVNCYGKGKVFYVGCDLDETGQLALAKIIAKEADIVTTKLPKGVELVNRKHCFVLMNHNEEPVQTGIVGKSLLTGKDFAGKLEGFGVEVLEK